MGLFSTAELAGLGVVFGLVAGVAVGYQLGAAAAPIRVDNMACGHVDNPVTQKDLASLARDFRTTSWMEGEGGIKFETWRPKDDKTPGPTIVVARFNNGQVCYAPTPGQK